VAKYAAAVRLAALDKSCAEYLKSIAKEVTLSGYGLII
jgi:hypothetical protein